MAPGSASRTLVSSAYVRRSDPVPAWHGSMTGLACLDRLAVAEMATHTPLASSGVALDTNVSDGPGPASEGPGAGPPPISPACPEAKLENLQGLPAVRLRTARQFQTVPVKGHGAKVAGHHRDTEAGRMGAR